LICRNGRKLCENDRFTVDDDEEIAYDSKKFLGAVNHRMSQLSYSIINTENNKKAIKSQLQKMKKKIKTS